MRPPAGLDACAHAFTRPTWDFVDHGVYPWVTESTCSTLQGTITYPTLGKGTSSTQKWLLMVYVTSQEGRLGMLLTGIMMIMAYLCWSWLSCLSNSATFFLAHVSFNAWSIIWLKDPNTHIFWVKHELKSQCIFYEYFMIHNLYI